MLSRVRSARTGERPFGLASISARTPQNRSLSRAFAIRQKIGGMGGIGDYIGKPKGMHWRTFERAMERVNDVEKIILGDSARWLERLSGQRRKRKLLSRPDGPRDDGAIHWVREAYIILHPARCDVSPPEKPTRRARSPAASTAGRKVAARRAEGLLSPWTLDVGGHRRA